MRNVCRVSFRSRGGYEVEKTRSENRENKFYGVGFVTFFVVGGNLCAQGHKRHLRYSVDRAEKEICKASVSYSQSLIFYTFCPGQKHYRKRNRHERAAYDNPGSASAEARAGVVGYHAHKRVGDSVPYFGYDDNDCRIEFGVFDSDENEVGQKESEHNAQQSGITAAVNFTAAVSDNLPFGHFGFVACIRQGLLVRGSSGNVLIVFHNYPFVMLFKFII